MTTMDIHSYAAGQWRGPASSAAGGARQIAGATNNAHIATAGNHSLDTQTMLDHARDEGGTALRELTFHDRARLLKRLATHLDQHKQPLYELSHLSGATLADAKIDVDGGIATLFVFASKGRRELPDSRIYLDGDSEMLSRKGSFIGQHIGVPRRGVAVHINAFNFPVWGMLEKLAPALLAGVPCIVKPATDTCYITERCFRFIIDSGIVPEGSVQLLVGSSGKLLEQLQAQDLVGFTGSAHTAAKLKLTPTLLQHSIPFMAEQDSLNATVLGPDATPGSAEFDLLVSEVVTEMTVKAGQKCTAIRRIMVPAPLLDDVAGAISAKLAAIRIGDPSSDTTQMGALVSMTQKKNVTETTSRIGSECKTVFNGNNNRGDNPAEGAYFAPVLYCCEHPGQASHVHDVEAFGPVATIMPYHDADNAASLVQRGGGSLVTSLITADAGFATDMVSNAAAYNGRLYINNRDSMQESTGHGSPLPHMVHGGPGRAGGSEELGGVRAVQHYLQRTAVQGSPDMISAITGVWVPGAQTQQQQAHPFRRTFHELQPGDTLHAGPRQISIEDIETFAHFTGDTFYAHMDEEAAAESPFFDGRVAHGYLLLSFAAGLFVEPDPGPVLANTGLDKLQFMQPVAAGDSIAVQLTVKRKTPRTDTYGEVRWHVEITNQDEQAVASYELHTMNAYDQA